MDTDVRTQQGIVRGRIEEGVAVFKGIPYAAPPFGNEKRGGGLLLIYKMSHDPKNCKLKLEGQCLLTLPKT